MPPDCLCQIRLDLAVTANRILRCSTTATGAYRVKHLRRTDLPISLHTRKVIVEFISGPGRHTRRALRRKRTMRFNLHGEVLLDGEVGGAAGARPSSSAKKLSSAPVLPAS